MDIEQVLADLPRLCVDVTPIVETGEGASNSLGAVVVRGDYLWDNGKVRRSRLGLQFLCK